MSLVLPTRRLLVAPARTIASADGRLPIPSAARFLVEGDSIAAQSDGRSMAGWLATLSDGRMTLVPNTPPGTEGSGGDTLADVQGDIAAVLAEFPDMTHVVLHVGTNNLSASPLAAMQTTAEQIIDAYNAAGVHVVFSGILKRLDAVGLTAGVEDKRRAFNAWLAALPGKALTFVDHDAVFDPSNPTHVQTDLLHPKVRGIALICQNVLDALRFEAPSAAALLPVNAVVNASFAGTSGSVATGFAGGSVAPTNWTIDNDTGATVAASVVEIGGVRTVQFDVSGAATTTAQPLRLYRNEAGIPLNVGEWAEGIIDLEIAGAGGIGDPVGLTGWQYAIGDSSLFKADHSPSTYGAMDQALRHTVRCLPVLETSASTFQAVGLYFRFAVGTVAARIRIASPHAGRHV